MEKLLHIILISCFCITVIYCVKKDESSNSIYSSSDADETFSSLLTEADEEINDWIASSTCPSSKLVFYVEKEVLSRY